MYKHLSWLSPFHRLSLSRDLFHVTPVNRFHIAAGGIRDPASILSQGLYLSLIHGHDLLNKILIRALNCTPQEEYKQPLQLLQTVHLQREGKIIDVKSGVASKNHMYTPHHHPYISSLQIHTSSSPVHTSHTSSSL